ncbi:helix-turn-helix domain-containing protein (plasmid) [Clostridium perfringens]
MAKLRNLRIDKVLSQREVAALIGKNVSFISDLENNKIKDIKLSTACQLSKIYGIDPINMYHLIME